MSPFPSFLLTDNATTLCSQTRPTDTGTFNDLTTLPTLAGDLVVTTLNDARNLEKFWQNVTDLPERMIVKGVLE